MGLREDVVEMIKQLFLCFDQLCLLLQRLSDALDSLRECHECLREVRVNLFKPTIRISEYTAQRFRDPINTISFTLNRSGGGRWTKRVGPSVERGRYGLHIAEEDGVFHHRRCVRYL